MLLTEAILNKLKEVETSVPKRKVEVEIKKAIVQFFQNEGYNKAETLVKLNEALEQWGKDPVTISCVKYHWLNDNVE